MEDVLKVMEMVATDGNDHPRTEVTIVNCGQLGSIEDVDIDKNIMTNTKTNTVKNNQKDSVIISSQNQSSSTTSKIANKYINDMIEVTSTGPENEENDNQKDNNNNRDNNDINNDNINENSTTDSLINIEEKTKNMSATQKKLFLLRMKINQSRKANKEETIAEFKRFSDPKYDAKQRYLEKKQQVL